MAKKKKADKASNPKPHEKFLDAVRTLVDAFAVLEGDVTQAFSQCVSAVQDTLPKGDMGVSGMTLHLAVMDFLVQADLYDNRWKLDANWSPGDQPGDEFWSTLVTVDKAYKTHGKPLKSARAPESVEYLVKTIPDQGQVARMLGLFTEDGAADIARLQQEIATPGSVINDDFLHPDDAKRDAKLAEKHAEYVSLLKDMTPEPKAEETCPETPEELYRTEVPIDSAVKMLKLKPHYMTPAQVAAKWTEFRDAGIEQNGVVTTGRTGEPLSEYVVTTGPTTEPTFTETETPEVTPDAEETPTGMYAQSSETDLAELCEVAGISTEGKYRSEMIAALEEADKQGAEA